MPDAYDAYPYMLVVVDEATAYRITDANDQDEDVNFDVTILRAICFDHDPSDDEADQIYLELYSSPDSGLQGSRFAIFAPPDLIKETLIKQLRHDPKKLPIQFRDSTVKSTLLH